MTERRKTPRNRPNTYVDGMALTGDLGSIDLANVFQMLLLSQKTGTLEVRSSGSRTEVYLDGETVLYPFDRDVFPSKVLRLLERAGTVTTEAVAKAHSSAQVLKRDIFAVLVQMHALTLDDVAAAYRVQMEEEIYELFVDRGATFEFREGERPVGHGKVIAEEHKLSGQHLIMEAARRLDEWGYIREKVASDACVFEKGGALDTVAEEDRDGALIDVFTSLDGVRNVTAVIEATSLTRFVVCKKLAFLSLQHVVYEVPVEVLLERAGVCLREKRSEQGLALLERAFELGANQPQVHEMAALANHALNRVGEACRHHALVAEALERAGDRRGAAEVWLRVRDLLPTDVRSRERLVHHWLDEPEFFADTKYDGTAEAIELVQILKEIGRDEDARRLLHDARKRFASDMRLIVKLADLSLELSDPRGAVEILMAGADELLARRQGHAALRLYRRVRSIEPQHDGLDMRIASCERAGRIVTKNPRRVVRTTIMIVILVGLAVAFAEHNREVLGELAELDTEALALHGDFETALGTLAAFRVEHPMTVASFVAARRMQDLDARARRHEANATRRSELLASDRTRRQRSAERAYGEAVEAMRRGNYLPALDAMKRAAALAMDPRWIETEKPSAKAAEIELYLQAAHEEFKHLQEARARGDWAEVHRNGAALLRDHPFAAEAKGLALPVRIVPDPADATVDALLPDGAHATTQGPTLLLLLAGVEAQVTCTRAERFAQVIRFKPETAFEVVVRLERCPDRSVELPVRVLHAPVLFGDRAFFGCDHGRILAVDLATLVVAWQKTLPDLHEVAAPPVFDELGLRVRTSDRRVLWLDPANGDVLSSQADVEPPFVAGTVHRIVARTNGGSFEVDAEGRIARIGSDGLPGPVWRSPGQIEWCVATPDGGALFGGGALLLKVGEPVGNPVEDDKSGAGDGR